MKTNFSQENIDKYKNFKKEYHRIQRREIILLEQKEINNISRIAKSKNKNSFWK